MQWIRQARVSSAISTFEEQFMEKFGFTPYKNKRKPAVFFGCYPPGPNKRPDINLALNHKAMAVIIWGGSDAKKISSHHYRRLRSARHLYHCAISDFIVKDLNKVGLPCVKLPICPTRQPEFKPEPLGPCVYSYSNHNHPHVYNEKLVRRIEAALPDIEFIVGYRRPPGNFTDAEMPSVYKRCFLGLRLTDHDGLSNTVVELGLMGRKCVWNSRMPHTIQWKKVEDVIDIIKRERKNVGKTFPQVAQDVEQFLRLPRKWLTTSFWKTRNSSRRR